MISGIDYLNKKPVAIEIAGGRIKRISDGTNTEQLILPGLFDLQINGFAGVDFNGPDLTCEDLEKAVIALAKTGITGFMPTIITNSPKAIKDRLAFLRRFQEESKWGVSSAVSTWKARSSHLRTAPVELTLKSTCESQTGLCFRSSRKLLAAASG